MNRFYAPFLVVLLVSLLCAAHSWAQTTSQPQTLLTNQQPSTSRGVDAWELGTRMSADVGGRIMAIRYYRLAGDNGAHTGRIWSSAGLSLASVSFAPQPGRSGWQEQALTVPVSVAAGVSWTVSVDSSPGTHYALTPDGFSPVLTNGHLTGTAGVYGPSGTYPDDVTPTNYFRDVVFDAAVVPAGIAITPDTSGGFIATLNGFQPGSYTLSVTLKDAAGTVTAAFRSIIMPPMRAAKDVPQ